MLAIGLARIQTGQQEGPLHPDGASGGLPSAWVAGVRRLCWRVLEQGRPPLPSHQDVFRWCRLPLDEWPLELLVSEADEEPALVENGRLSAFADQSASLLLAKDPEAELVENRCFELLLATADGNAASEEDVQRNYVDLRRYFVEHPVVADAALTQLLRRFRARNTQGQPWVKELFLMAYRFQPGGGTVELSVCTGCGNPLSDGQFLCGTPGCEGRPTRRRWEAMEGIYVQHRATRRYFHDPASQKFGSSIVCTPNSVPGCTPGGAWMPLTLPWISPVPERWGRGNGGLPM
ncbi:pPIWI_RE_Y domain-containing protein [Streptomyces jumonjinensis]|uniref:pPIWI_RE_Y domain-containing protein n=1 Tax=Streptomyces jumonjinensis TaxID=1945 RepID=UPI0037B7865A